MNRLAAWTFAAGLACTGAADIACAAPAAGTAEPTPQALLEDAILCQGDPLAAVRKMTAGGPSSFDRGFAAATFGEEMDEMNVVILRSPLEIAGAKTSAVLMTFAQSEDFGALVYGRFRGDYRQAVSALKLVPTAKKDGLRLGQFTRALAVGADGRPDKVCPMTIVLNPLENGTFLLGCGWCNG
ncbi:MAG TPA: hypothetical protein VMW27_12215 [Thermoanaerobaculia bacterium]|nr:hypothetical protein [Thermoanaerobaculia bacterium]